MTPHFPATPAALLLALLGAAGAAAAQTPAAAAAWPVLTGPQAPSAPPPQRLEQLRQEAAPRARALAGSADGYAVDTTNREAVRLFHATVLASTQGVASGWSGSVAQCNPGSTSAAYQQAALRGINWFRAMAGVPAGVALDANYSRKAQQTALMMSAQRQLSHSPGASWACWSAEGAEGAASSNLALGRAGADAVANGYMRDNGAGNAALGHRRWVLYPQTRAMGVGDAAPEGQGGAAPANALWVFDGNSASARPAVRDDFVAWPPRGYVPWTQVYPRWSLSYPRADFSRATVRMTENGRDIATRLEPVANGYGENTLAWLPGSYSDGANWARPAQDTVYAVSVDNVLVGGSPRSFSYSVTVFDPAAAPPLAAPQGPTTLTPGQTGQYGLATTVAGADLQWRALTLDAPDVLREGAEGSAPAFTLATSPGYAAVASDVAASGARSFHLAQPAAQDQVLQLQLPMVPGPSAQLSFSSRLGVATAQQLALVEVSLDGGTSWQELYRQAGQGVAQAERGFTRRTIALGAYADRAIVLRWRYTLDGLGSFYPQTDSGMGWYIDDIELAGAQRVAGTGSPAPVPAGGLSFAASSPGTVLLQGRQGLYGYYDAWGAALRVQVAGAPLPGQEAQAECVMNWAEQALPQLLAPRAATRTDVAGLRYRFYAASGSYLGLSSADGHLYYLAGGAAQLQDLGRLADWLAPAGCR